MTTRITAAALAAGLLVVALAGCAGSTPDSAPPDASPSGAPPAATSDSPDSSESPDPSDSTDEPTASAELMVADSPLGEIVVDAEGMTVYMFDNDTQGSGASSCEGQCAENWPAVTTEADAPVVDGVTGEVGTITGVDGATQLTLNGWPLYVFAGDSVPGDVAGQGVNEVWWVLSPAGERLAE